MAKFFDLVAVEFDNGMTRKTDVFYAPDTTLNIGDMVCTEISCGEFDGRVVNMVTVWTSDKTIDFLTKYNGIQKILSVQRKLDFSGLDFTKDD